MGAVRPGGRRDSPVLTCRRGRSTRRREPGDLAREKPTQTDSDPESAKKFSSPPQGGDFSRTSSLKKRSTPVSPSGGLTANPDQSTGGTWALWFYMPPCCDLGYRSGNRVRCWPFPRCNASVHARCRGIYGTVSGGVTGLQRKPKTTLLGLFWSSPTAWPPRPATVPNRSRADRANPHTFLRSL